MLHATLSEDSVTEIKVALGNTSGDWTARPVERGLADDNDYVVVPFLGDGLIKIPTRFNSQGRIDFKHNIHFLANARRYVEQLLNERANLLNEIDEWKSRAEDYRDILIQQGRAEPVLVYDPDLVALKELEEKQRASHTD